MIVVEGFFFDVSQSYNIQIVVKFIFNFCNMYYSFVYMIRFSSFSSFQTLKNYIYLHTHILHIKYHIAGMYSLLIENDTLGNFPCCFCSSDRSQLTKTQATQKNTHVNERIHTSCSQRDRKNRKPCRFMLVVPSRSEYFQAGSRIHHENAGRHDGPLPAICVHENSVVVELGGGGCTWWHHMMWQWWFSVLDSCTGTHTHTQKKHIAAQVLRINSKVVENTKQ